MKNAFWKLSILGVCINCLFCFFPIAPFMSFIGGFVGAYYLSRRAILYFNKKLLFKERLIFYILSSLISGFIIAYLFTLIFFATLGKPLEESWLQIESFETILRKSCTFRWLFFSLNFIFSAFSNFLGCFIAFKLGISKNKPSEESILARFDLKDLLKYLD